MWYDIWLDMFVRMTSQQKSPTTYTQWTCDLSKLIIMCRLLLRYKSNHSMNKLNKFQDYMMIVSLVSPTVAYNEIWQSRLRVNIRCWLVGLVLSNKAILYQLSNHRTISTSYMIVTLLYALQWYMISITELCSGFKIARWCWPLPVPLCIISLFFS